MAVLAVGVQAHPISFNSTITYSSAQPSGGAAAVSNWTGAAFDAANVGGSGVNADGGANNGTANDASTYVSNAQPVQGQTFVTGSNANGYDASSITVRMAGYTNNTATGSNLSYWDLNFTNGPIIVSIGKVNGTTYATQSKQCFTSGGVGNPGADSSANGSGTYLTFNLPFPVHLDPNTTYGFDFIIANGGSNYFEWLGTSATPYASGTAYTRSGTTLTPLTGDRVFMVNMTAATTAYAPFAHPGVLHTQADLDRMKAKVTAGAEPWISDYNILTNSPWAQTGWPAYDVDYIVRGPTGSNYTRCQQDAQAIYELALRWKLTGNTAYADKAVQIANVWSGLLGVTGDTNASLAAGICGYLFASGGEILTTYPGWVATDKQAYKDMMMRVFYASNFDFFWRHYDTFWRTGGNTHYRLNWDTDNMASMAAIGILCDNRAVYQQALDYFKNGPGNGRVERAAWYVHPDGMAQTEEIGRDQGHNFDGWYSMALLCQMAWNQGDDLFGYENNRVLRAFEVNAKYNLGNDVLSVYHRNSDLAYTEQISSAERGKFIPMYELVYNHYANVLGIAAPYSKLAMTSLRPEPRPDPSIHPSQVDWLGLGSLTFAQDSTTLNVAPSGLAANWSKNQVILTWWGSATATGYQIKRATSAAGPYTAMGTAGTVDLNFTDTVVSNGGTYYYVVTAVTPGGNLDSTPLLVNQSLVDRYTFDNTPNDAVGTRNATLQGGSTGLPAYAAGKVGSQAINLDGVDDYVQLPVNSGCYQDITLSAWVYWNGGAAQQRVFDFGSEIEKDMYLTPYDGSGVRFGMTTSRGTDGTLSLGGPALPTGKWTHVAVTINGGTGTLYVNGVPVDSEFSAMVAPLFGQPFCYLGKSMWNADPLFSGRIDDFRIYNYALSGKEVYALWGGSTNAAPAFAVNPVTLTNATEKSDYAATGQTLAGLASDANGGTLTYSKVTGPDWLTVAANGALSGTPANADVGANSFVVRVTDPSGATDDANLYVTVINVNDPPAWTSNPLAKPSVTQGLPYSDTLADSAGDVDVGDTITFSKVSGPAWLGVAANGALSGTPAAANVGTNSFVVRATDSTGAFANTTLTIPVLGNSLQSNYSLDGSGADGTGANTATINGTATYVPGVAGQALSFDGTSTYATLPALSNQVYKDLTVSAWVYWNGRSAWQRIFDFGSGTDGYLFLTPYNNSTGMRFAIKVSGGVEQDVDAPLLPLGQWVHVAVTLGGNTATIYINGVAKASSSAITNSPSAISLTNNYIGKSQFSADPLFNGKIDDFRIYNYALSASEVAALLNSVPVVTPGNVAAFPSNGQVRLTWSPSANATTYTVKRGTTNGGPYTAVSGGSGLTAPTLTDTGLTNGTTYYYVVSAKNASGVESASSTEVAAAPKAATIDVPNSGFETPVTLTYAYAPSGAGWTFSTQSGSNGAGISGNGSTFTSSNAVAPEGLQVALLQGSGSLSQALGGFLPGNSYTVTFSAANRVRTGDAESWNVQIDGTSVKSFSAVSTSYTDYTATFTASASSHTLQFVGTGAANNTVFIDNVRVAVTPPPVPSGLAVSGISSSQIMLTWGASSGATAYNLKRSATSGGPYVTIASAVGATNFTDTGLTSGTTYYYVVSALNSLTESGNSSEVAVTVINATPSAPTALTATPGNAKVVLNWTAPFGATSYNVKRKGLGGTYATMASGIIATSYTDAGLSAGTTYVYKVSAQNNSGEGLDSNEASATVYGAIPTGWSSGNVGGGSGSALYGQERQFVISGAGGAFTTSSTDATAGTMGGSRFAYIGSNSTTQIVTARVANPPTVAGAQFGLMIRRVAPGGTDNRMAALVMEATGGGTYQARLGIVGATTGTALAWSGTAANLTLPQWIRLSRSGSSYTAQVSTDGSTWTTVSTDYYGAPSTSTYYAGLFVSSGSTSTLCDVGFDNVSIVADSNDAWTPLAAPTGLTAALSGSNASLAWTAVTGATSYRVERGSTSGGPYVVVATGLTATSYSDPISSGPWYYVVRAANNASGVSAASAPSNGVTAPPAAPSGVTATAYNAAVGLSWIASGGGTSYTVSRATTSGGPYTAIATGVTTSTYMDTGLSNNTTYHYVVTASNSAGTSANSTDVSATPVGPPGTPTGLTATAGNTSVTLSWSPAATAASYKVKRLAADGSSYLTIATGVTATTYTDTGLTNATAYSYVVSAVNVSGESADSASASATPFPPPDAPTGVTATAGNARVTLNWNAVAGATGYVVKRAILSGGPFTVIVSNLPFTTYTDAGLTNNSIYYYTVSAMNGAGAGADSAVVSAVPMTLPATPVNLTATPGNTRVALKWSAADNAASYNVKRSLVSGGPYNTVGTTTTVSFTDTGLVNKTTYYYVVSAVDSVGESANSTEASATANPRSPFQPYTADASTLLLFHLDETAGGAVTTNVGTAGKRAYSVDETTAVTTPATVSTVIGAAASYAGFGNCANLAPSGAAAGLLVGWDADNSGVYQGDVSSTSLSADKIAMTALNMGNGAQTPWTVEAMVYSTLGTLNANQEILCTDSSATSRGFQFRLNSSGQLELNFITGVGSGTADIKTAIPTTGAHAYAANTWFHVAAVYDGTSVQFYWTKMDPSFTSANLLSSTAAGVGTTVGAITGPLCLGNENRGAAGERFQGRIDEMRASSVARAATDFYWQSAPPTPAGLTASAGNAQVVLNWTASSGAVAYNVKRAASNGGPYVTIASPTATGFADTTAVNGTTYYYVVSAVSDTLESGDSAQVSATPQAPAPVGLTATAGNGQVALSWSAMDGAATYNVKRATAAGGTYTTIASPATANYLDASAANGTTYYYVVSAMTAGVESGNSAQVSATPVSARQSWRQLYFGTTSNTGTAADNADPDYDGKSNLLEYATGTNPTVAQPGVAAAAGITADRTKLTLKFHRIADPALTYQVLASNDLLTWTVIWTSTGAQNTAGDMEVPDADLISAHTRRFLMLQVSP